MAWLNPTGYNDPSSTWTSEALAYDGNTGTYAYTSVPKNGWSGYLELSRAATSCDKVRGWFNEGIANVSGFELDVYYSSAWHNIYNIEPTYGQFVEFPIGSTQSITGVRCRFYSTKAGSAGGHAHDVEFWGSEPITVIPTTASLSITPYSSVVSVSDNKLATPTTLALTVTPYIPVIGLSNNITIIPPLLALSLTTYAPIINAPRSLGDKQLWVLGEPHLNNEDHIEIWSLGEPYVVIDAVTVAGTTVTPTTASLSITEYAPILKEVTTPGTLSLSLTSYVPVLREVTTPTTLSLVLTSYIPILKEVVTPTTLSLTLTSYIPVLKEVLTPTTLSLNTTGYVPVIGMAIIPSLTSLVIAGYAPILKEILTPSTLSLSTTGYVPVLGEALTPTTLSLSLTGYIPVLNTSIVMGLLELILTEYAPTVVAQVGFRRAWGIIFG